jgi:hypothetical protein
MVPAYSLLLGLGFVLVRMGKLPEEKNLLI